MGDSEYGVLSPESYEGRNESLEESRGLGKTEGRDTDSNHTPNRRHRTRGSPGPAEHQDPLRGSGVTGLRPSLVRSEHREKVSFFWRT